MLICLLPYEELNFLQRSNQKKYRDKYNLLKDDEKLEFYEGQNNLKRADRIGRRMSTGLSVSNINFGINDPTASSVRHALGRRHSVIRRHGGTVAEYAWKSLTEPPENQHQDYKPTPQHEEIDEELKKFYKLFNQQKPRYQLKKPEI